MKKIKLTKEKYAIVDDEDFEYLNQFRWWSKKARNDTFYAVARTIHGENISMHRLLMNTPPGKETDHANRDTLDNRKSNLRICTTSQNQANRGITKNNKAGFKGIYWCTTAPKDRRYKAQIRYMGKQEHIGYFANKIQATLAYDKKAKELFGEFAGINKN